MCVAVTLLASAARFASDPTTATAAARSSNIAAREALDDSAPLAARSDIADDPPVTQLRLAACGAWLHFAGHSGTTRDRNKRACIVQSDKTNCVAHTARGSVVHDDAGHVHRQVASVGMEGTLGGTGALHRPVSVARRTDAGEDATTAEQGTDLFQSGTA